MEALKALIASKVVEAKVSAYHPANLIKDPAGVTAKL
jgi:hypothetical protein